MIRTLAKAAGVASLTFCVLGCVPRSDPRDEALTIELRWVESYPRERRSRVETGLLWTLSFLGASLPSDEPFPLEWQDDIVTLGLDRVGIGADALASWRRLLAAMKASEEYRSTGAIDIGRFVALTLCSPQHYYALTGARPSYEEARTQFEFDPKPVAIIESSVAKGHRIIEIATGSSLDGIAFLAHEGTGDVQRGTFRVMEHELLDVMPNGQLRFALYDANGALKSAADSALTAAGKPSKCLWCHESELLRPFGARTSVDGFHSLRAFEDQLSMRTESLHRTRSELSSEIDFERDQDHTLAELLYVAFYEPSADRLAREWGLPLERVLQMLDGLPTHAHAEFPFLGDALYHRSQVDMLAPYGVIEVPTDPREPSDFEPDLLR